MSVFSQITASLEQMATVVPLELFSLIGSFVEEIIAPIPSPLVMTLSGSLAEAQQRPFAFLLILALIGAVGKTIGALILYIVADKGEDFLIERFGKFLGVSHKEIEGIGKYFRGDWRDDFLLTVLRAIPVLPSAPISVVCGVIKVQLRTYLTSTFVGTTVRNLIFLLLGYYGLHTSTELMNGLDSLETLFQLLTVGAIGLFVVWIYWQRQKGGKLPWMKERTEHKQ